MKIRKLTLRFIIPIVAAIFAVCAFCCIPLNTASSAGAEENERHGYYYSRISIEARRLYDAIGQMHSDGTLKSGNGSYDLVSSEALTAAQLNTVTENSAVMAAFGAARDAYYLDHPELFYIDFSRLTINVGTRKGEYTATLGSGRADTYYIENGFSSAAEIDAAITAFDTALNAVVDAAKKCGG